MLTKELCLRSVRYCKMTETFKTESRVKQEGLLSHLLFIIYRDTPLGCRRLRPIYFDKLFYIDDVILCANTKQEIWCVWVITLHENENWQSTDLKTSGSILEKKRGLEGEINNRITNTSKMFRALYPTCFNKKELRGKKH